MKPFNPIEPLKKHCLLITLDTPFLQRYLKCEYQVKQCNVLLSDARYYSVVNARHDHCMEEIFINGELFVIFMRLLGIF